MTDAATKLAIEIDERELETYRKFVEAIAKMADGKPIFNRSPAHAAVVVEFLLNGATKEFNVITGELYQQVYAAPAVIAAAVRFLTTNPDAEIHILSEKAVGKNTHPLLTALAAAGVDARVKLKQLKEDVVAGTPFHFAVADANAFRFESDKKLMEAVIQFGKKDIGQKLETIFQRLWTTGTV